MSLNTSVGNFQAVFCEELMDGLSTHTLAFSGVNNNNERAIWGYKYTKTAITNTTNYDNQVLTVGSPDYSLVWNAYDQFHQVQVSGEFEVEFVFENFTEAVENWHNWALYMTDETSNWYLRADAWSNETFTGATVDYQYNWNWDTEFKQVFANKEVRVLISRVGTTINVTAFVEGEQVYAVSSKNSTEEGLTIYLGGEAVYLDVKKSSVSQLSDRQVVGNTSDNGTYTSGFNSVASEETTLSGDFELKYSFYNHRQAFNADNWDNYIVRASSGGQNMLLRADAYALDPVGTVNHTYDWAWEDFVGIMMGAYIEMTITREGNTVTYDAEITATDGQVYHYNTINTGAPTADMTFSLTMEQSMVDLIETEVVQYEICTNDDLDTDNDGTPDCLDFCVNDPNKIEPGNCGCSILDGDADGDGIENCNDSYPYDYDNDGVTTTDDCDDTNPDLGPPSTWYADTDADGIGDASSAVQACTQPQGYVADLGDDCPNDINKTTPGDCGCGETEQSCFDCNGDLNGSAYTDECENCVGGNTGNEACTQDCYGDWGGTAALDVCDQCAGGNTGIIPVTDSQNCIATSIDDFEAQFNLAYPNPTSGQLYLKETTSWILLDMTGVELQRGMTNSISLEAYRPGIYFLQVHDEMIKVVKE